MTDPIVRRWELTDVQLKVLCEDRRFGGLPRPLTFTSRTRFADDYEAEKAQVRAELAGRADPEFDRFVRALTRPDVMFVVYLWNEQDYTDPRQRLRVHATRCGDHGYVITQRPGETVAHSGGFDIAEYAPEALPRVLADLPPDVPAGGDPAGMRGGSGSAEAPPEPAVPRSTAAETTSRGPNCGVVKVIQGHLGFREPGIVHVGLAWRDLPGDGRYAVGPEATDVLGMDNAAIRQWIDARTAEIMLRLAP